MDKKFWRALFICIGIICLIGLGAAYGQQKKVGGGEIKYQAKGSTDPVVFNHETHVTQQKAKCTDCHTKIFKMKKGESKMTQDSFAQGKFCGACHDGKKAFSAVAQADCAKCHKK
ncbi:MAG: hypothetical protein HY882_01415 [Deltaproteobacteria bacterium]|nr:hypothetical protein [Deltaproteobacteria bacterium]